MNLKPKNLLFASLLLLAAGCGHHQTEAHEGKLVFKGHVARVEYRLVEGVTVLIDAEGKSVKIEGHPGVPCAEVEIFQTGEHEYEIFQAPRSS